MAKNDHKSTKTTSQRRPARTATKLVAGKQALQRPTHVRFGTDYAEAAMAASGRKLIVVNDGEMKDDLVEDMIAAMTSFCARLLYGRRSAGRRALASISAIESHDK